MSLADLTASTQSYLMAVYSLGRSGGQVTPGALAKRLGASPSTVTEGVGRLVAQGLAHHAPYSPVELTETGRAYAVAMFRRHRILETFLCRTLGYAWDEVHAEADALEHVVSDRLVDALDAFLGHPERDPHGDPIPTADGADPATVGTRLDRVEEGSGGRVARVSDRDGTVLRFLDSVGLRPDVPVSVRERHLELGTLTVEIDGAATQLGLPAAAAVWLDLD